MSRLPAARHQAGRVNGRGHGSRGQGQRASARTSSTSRNRNEDVFILPATYIDLGFPDYDMSVCVSVGQNRVVTSVNVSSNGAPARGAPATSESTQCVIVWS